VKKIIKNLKSVHLCQGYHRKLCGCFSDHDVTAFSVLSSDTTGKTLAMASTLLKTTKQAPEDSMETTT